MQHASIPQPCVTTRSCRRATVDWISWRTGATLRILDLEGNQAVDTLFYNAADTARTLQRAPTRSAAQAQYLSDHRHRLMSNEGNAMLTIVADTCGRHDTLGGACCRREQHGALRAGQAPHARLPRQLSAGAALSIDVRPRQARPHPQHQLLHERAGHAGRRAALSRTAFPAPGKYVELRAEMDVLVLISNCPQLNNPCNAYNPTPVEC